MHPLANIPSIHNMAPFLSKLPPPSLPPSKTHTLSFLSLVNQLTIQWDQVHNDDHVSDGPFTFQLTLLKNGEIHFAYRQVSMHSCSIIIVTFLWPSTCICCTWVQQLQTICICISSLYKKVQITS